MHRILLDLMTLIILAEDGRMAENVLCATKFEAVVEPDTYFGDSPPLFRYGASPQQTKTLPHVA